MHPDPAPYDAVLLVSFGGPEKPEDVIPFLANVTRGRGIPEERLAEVGQHYTLFGGRSPINDQNRSLLDALATDFAGVGLDLPIYWGNRNWDPMLRDTVARMAGDGIRRAACFVTSAYSSYSGCRQYREDLAGAVDGIEGAPVLDRLRAYFNHPGFVEPFVDATLSALAQVNPARRDRARLVFVTHSIPTAMNEGSGEGGGAYVRQHQEVMRQVVERVRAETGHRHDHELVYCSRSGSPHVPWLEPDVNDHLEALVEAEPDAPPVVIVPIGFVSDHMEVIYDLDTEAMATAERLGVECVRASTPGVDPRFVAMVRDLVLERAAVERGEQVDRATVGDLPACWDHCLPDCCPNPRGLPLPTVGTRE